VFASLEDRVENPLAFSPDGVLLAAAIHESRDDRRLRLWKFSSTPQKLGDVKNVNANTLVFSENGKMIWCASSNSPYLRTIDVDRLIGHESDFASDKSKTLNSVGVLHGESQLVTAGSDRTLRLWDAKGGESTIIGAEMNVCGSVAVSPAGKRVVCGDSEGWITLRDLDLPPAIPMLEQVLAPSERAPIASITFSPDGRLLYIGRSALNIVDASTLKLNRTTLTKNTLAVSSDCVLAASFDEIAGKLDIWNLAADLPAFSLDTGQISRVVFSRDDRYLAAWKMPRSGRLQLWDTRT
jgi:WD40 repeat protein